VGSRTDFELRRRSDVDDSEKHLFFLFSYTSWWSRPDQVSSAGGLNRTIGFRTPKAAKAWVREQFEVPITRWIRRKSGIYVAAKGDLFPPDAGYHVPGRRGLTNPDRSRRSARAGAVVA
jgi:hypothetical protein